MTGGSPTVGSSPTHRLLARKQHLKPMMPQRGFSDALAKVGSYPGQSAAHTRPVIARVLR
ncbi:hypothetical protein [Streptomyces sp. NPDC001970]